MTHLEPKLGVQLTGSLAVTWKGYVWYTFVELPAVYSLGSIFLDEALRKSLPPSRLDDMVLRQRFSKKHSSLDL